MFNSTLHYVKRVDCIYFFYNMKSNTFYKHVCFMLCFFIVSNVNALATSSSDTTPVRTAKVYIGISNAWHETADPLNYQKWDYVRRNSTGFYTNFIAMWVNFYQNKVGAQQSCNNMRKAFLNGECFFETSMETKVNSGVNGFNNDSTDRRSLDLLTNAGFKVTYTSLNYGYDEQRVNLLRTYRGNRKCFYLAAPWRYGGDIFSNNASTNATVRTNILNTDGMQTDGPLGFWFVNRHGMQPASISLVKYCQQFNLESAVMLAPYAAGMEGYNSATDFLNVSKHCVFMHEDEDAAPDIWTIWTYGSDSLLENFPESIVNENNEVDAPNTKMGVAYWLIKHLKNFPTVIPSFSNIKSHDAKVTQVADSIVEIELNKGVELKIPIEFSNSIQPAIELSPLVKVRTANVNSIFNISFYHNNKDITTEIMGANGTNFIRNLRLTKTNKVVIEMRVSVKSDNQRSDVVELFVESMSNKSNTVNPKISYVFKLKPKVVSSTVNLLAPDYKIYPNPTSDFLNINSSDVLKKIELFDLMGQRIYVNHTNSTNYTIDIKKICKPGFYMLKLNKQVVKIKVQ